MNENLQQAMTLFVVCWFSVAIPAAIFVYVTKIRPKQISSNNASSMEDAVDGDWFEEPEPDPRDYSLPDYVQVKAAYDQRHRFIRGE